MLERFKKDDKNTKKRTNYIPVIVSTVLILTLVHSYYDDLMLIRRTVERKENKKSMLLGSVIRKHPVAKDKEEEMKNLVVLPYNHTNLPQQQSSPNGTFVVFFHLGKTGGTSIKYNLRKLKGVKYNFCTGLLCCKQAKMKIDDAFQTYFTSTTATYILELHAGNIPPLVTLGDQIQAWRDVSAAHNVTFFAFTIIRNPLAQTISHFNDHCLVRQRSECQLAKDASLVDSFILSKEHVPNFQTHYYLLGNARPYHALYQPQKWKEKEGITVNHTDGQLVFQSMVQHLDWVGTTECISTDTFQILQSIIPNYKNETNTFKAFNVGSKKKEIHQKGLTEDMLSLSQLDSVQKLMNVDVDLYHNVTNHFGSCLFT